MTTRWCRWVIAAGFAVALGVSHAETPRVVLVQPSGSTVPSNLLRLSIRFSGRAGGPVLPRLTVLRADGGRIEQPFLEQELWSADGLVLTVLMHPGRVKSGLIAREERGAILSARDSVTLALDGRPIKRWQVGPADEMGPSPSAWKVSAVRARSMQPLVISLDAPIDGRDADYLAIADPLGHRMSGRAHLTDGESRWQFNPAVPWKSGEYKIVARGTLEDAAGNRLNSRFETSVDSPPGQPSNAVISFVPAP